jgi:signal transduction histidine kinase
MSLRSSLRTRILFAFTLLYALILAAIASTTLQMRTLGEDFRDVNEGYLPLARIAARLQIHQERIDLDAARLNRSGDESRPLAGFRSNTGFHTGAFAVAIEEARSTAASALGQSQDADDLQSLATIERLLDRLDALRSSYEAAGRDWMAAEEVGEPMAEEEARATLVKSQQESQAVVAQFASFLDGRIREKSERIGIAQHEVTAVGAGLAALTLVVGLVILAWTLFTLRPIARLTSEVQRVAAGDYSGRVEVTRADEIGLLAGEFNRMAAALDERDRRLKERAAELDRLSTYLRSVLDTLHLGVLVAEDARSDVVNPAAASMWGAEIGAHLPAFLDVLAPGRHLALSVGDRRHDVVVVPFGTGGRLYVGEDVTERLLQGERAAHNQRLALVGQMLAQVVHEVRNPLNAISLNAEMLADELQGPAGAGLGEAAEILDLIVSEIRRLEGVTERYLDLARRPLLSPSPGDLGEVVRGICRAEESAFGRAGVRLECAVDEGLPEVLFDGAQLHRAVLNVLRNAMQSGAKAVRVTLRKAGGSVEIAVHDDGRGMDARTMDRAFEPFFTTRAKGTGLGLPLTRQVVEAHAGHVSIRSEPGKGSTVTLSLPLSEPPSEGISG